MKKSYLKRSTKPMKRGKLRVAGKSSASEDKREIQRLLRELVTLRDGGCVLRGVGACSGPLQAEHLRSRAYASTYGDPRNVVCLCQYHHIFFKKQHSHLYWEHIQRIIGEKRWNWLKRMEEDRSAHKADWKLVIIDLKQQIAKLK